MMAPKVLEARGVTKAFPGVVALRDVTVGLAAGEVHCLVGENGAGKSTLIKIFAGQYPPDEGRVLIDNKDVRFSSPADSRDSGIAVIHQELQLVPFLSVAENISLGQWPSSGLFVKWSGMFRRAEAALEQLGANVDPKAKVIDLPMSQQQLVEIARAISREAKVLIMDEPTASLSDAETDHLFSIIRRLRENQMAILYVSHRLEEVFEIADRITVIRDGRIVGSQPKSSIVPDDVVHMMVGGEVTLFPGHKRDRGAKILEVSGLARAGSFENVAFDIHQGEIVGLAGLVGAGRTEVARALFGLDPIDKGEIKIEGKPVRIDSPRTAMDLGIGFVPEDRKTQGLVTVLTVRENAVLSVLDRLNHFGWMDHHAESNLVETYRERLAIKTSSIDAPVISLSGGNQQKVIIARWLATNPKILILDEPTRGVDVGAKAEIHRLIEQLVASGMAILMISSELPELLMMSDRILVMRKGRIVAEIPGERASKEEVMQCAAGSTEMASRSRWGQGDGE